MHFHSFWLNVSKDVAGVAYSVVMLCINQEYQKDNRNLVISETEMKQTVYIYKCENCTIQVKGKVNAITVGQWQWLSVGSWFGVIMI